MASLAARLGFGDDDRVLIVNCDDLGSCHAANVGVYEALRDGVATSASPRYFTWRDARWVSRPASRYWSWRR